MAKKLIAIFILACAFAVSAQTRQRFFDNGENIVALRAEGLLPASIEWDRRIKS